MKHSLLLVIIMILAGSTAIAQDFRFTRPMGNDIPLNGSFLFGETSSSSGTQTGVEFKADSDTVFAAHDGTVGLVENSGSYGTSVTLDGMWGEEKVNTFYGQLASVLVAEDDEVTAGDPIAISGAEGNYMHFEVRLGWHSGETEVAGSRLNPEGWFAIDGMGIIVGSVPGADNSTRVDIDPDPKPRPLYDSYSYSLTYDFAATAIGSDPVYQENYIIGDVEPGDYTITSLDGSYSRSVTVPANGVVHADGGETSVEESIDLATQVSLNQNYPNPFNPSTVISYSIPEASHVSLAVYDLMGKQVAELTNRRMGAGTHEVSFNASELSSGIYFYRLSVDNSASLTRKLTLIK